MRRILVISSVICFLAAATNAKAVTISMKLVDITGGTAAGTHTIGLYVESDQVSSADDNGISGLQMDVMSVGTGNAAFLGTTSVTGTQLGNFGYGHNNAQALDADSSTQTYNAQLLPQPTLGYSASGDGDNDALGFSMTATPGNVDPVNVGAIGQTSGYELVAKEAWTFTRTETLNVYELGAQYFSDGTGNTFTNYDSALELPVTVTIPVPEPASMVLLGLGGLGLAAFARRRRS